MCKKMRKYEKKKKQDFEAMKHLPYYEEALDMAMGPMQEEEITDAWIYALSCGDEWEIVPREDNTLTVRRIDAF
jgi:hypothetical protein